MSKHKSFKVKYHYVIRYLQGESPTKLGKEAFPGTNPRYASKTILCWVREHKNGILDIPRTGKVNMKNSKNKKRILIILN